MVAMQPMVGGSSPKSAGFGAADLVWEQGQETALRGYRAGDVRLAARHWRRALAVAQEHFAPDDPRLAASLTNYGLLLRRQGQHFQAGRHFRDALDVWDRAWRWISLMTPPGQPDVCYDDATQAEFRALVELGRAATLMIEARGELPRGRLERWLAECPKRGGDLRKLLAAVFLIASQPA